MKFLRHLPFLCMALLAAGCSGVADLPPVDPGPPSGEYRLGPGDEVRVMVFDQPQLSDLYLVSDSGEIALPLIEPIQAAGATTHTVARRIAEELAAAQVVVSPSVSVEVRQYRPFFILGEVAEPGRYPYESDMTVLTAVAIAGGFTDRGRHDLFEITRARDGTNVRGRAEPETRIRPGDVIRVLQRYY
jgi:polysaccharide export outer membrane protein